MAVVPRPDHTIDDSGAPIIIDLGEIEVGDRETVRFVRTDPHLDPANVVGFSFTGSSNNPGLPRDFTTAGNPDAEISFEIEVTEPSNGHVEIQVACHEPGASFDDNYEIHFEGVNDATRAAAVAEAQRQAAAEARAQDIAARRAAAAAAGNAEPAAPARGLPSWLIAIIVIVIGSVVLGTCYMIYNAVQAPARAIMNSGLTDDRAVTSDLAPADGLDDVDARHSYFAEDEPSHLSPCDEVFVGPDGKTYIRHGRCEPVVVTTPAPTPVTTLPATTPCRHLPICP